MSQLRDRKSFLPSFSLPLFFLSTFRRDGLTHRRVLAPLLTQTSSRDESFLDLSIDIEQNTSITACLRQFSASETLCQRNKLSASTFAPFCSFLLVC
jgi:hypothetical protein